MVNLSGEAGHCLTMRSYCLNWAGGTWETGEGTLIPAEEGFVCENHRCLCWMFAMTSCLQKKGGSLRYLRAGPECHQRTDPVSVFRAPMSGSWPRDTTRLCFIEVSLT